MTEDQFKQLLEQNNAYLLKHIDKRFEQNNDQLLERMDKRLDKRLNERLEQNNAVLFGQLTKYLDGQITEVTNRLDKHDMRFDQIMSSLDQLLKQSETGEQEQAMIIRDQRFHKEWIGQLAKATNTKLVPEQ